MRYRGSGPSTTATPQRRQPQKSFPSSSFVQLCPETSFSLFRGGRSPNQRVDESKAFLRNLARHVRRASEKQGFFSKNAVREMAKQRPHVQSSQHSETASHRHTHTDTQGVAVAAKSRFLRFVSFLNLRKTHQHTVRQRASDAPLRRQHNTLTKKKKMLKLKRRRRRLYSSSRTAGLGDGLRMAGSYLGLP